MCALASETINVQAFYQRQRASIHASKVARLWRTLLVRRRLVAPATLLTVFVLVDVHEAFTASVEDPHALYFGGWFLYLGILLIVAGIEYGLRRLNVYQQFASKV